MDFKAQVQYNLNKMAQIDLNKVSGYKHVLNESYNKPTEKDKEAYKKAGKNGTLYYVVKGENGRILGYIDNAYIKKLQAKTGKNITPEAAAKIRLGNIEYFKRKK